MRSLYLWDGSIGCIWWVLGWVMGLLMAQALQAEIEDLLKADAEKEEILISRFDEAEALQTRLEQQQQQLEDLKSSQVSRAARTF